MDLKSRWGCQNHPEAKTATSLDGFFGVVEISGQIVLIGAILSGDVVLVLLWGRGENATEVDTSRELMVSRNNFMVTVAK